MARQHYTVDKGSQAVTPDGMLMDLEIYDRRTRELGFSVMLFTRRELLIMLRRIEAHEGHTRASLRAQGMLFE